MKPTFQLFRSMEDGEDYEPGTEIFHEGDDPGETMYVLLEGQVDILYRGERIDTIEGGTTLGELGLIDSGPRSATAVAKTHSRLVPVDRKRFEFLVQNTPHFALQVMRIMAERLRR